ncbi:hypothetical protein BVRB_4g092870 [Beta vulgaris subsp. vulgaris]|nr:hypothetical protein BVRB_4g092870 [Beta vulgaris subsp. vulgaris]
MADDERPPRGRDRSPVVVNLSGQSREPVIQENLKRLMTTTHLENVLNDFQTRMIAVVEEQIKSNMLFFQVNPDSAAVIPPKGQSHEGQLGASRLPWEEVSRRVSKGKQPAVNEQRRKMDWKFVVRSGDNLPPSGHKMEMDAREYLEAKKAVALHRSASGSTPYMRDPPLRLPSRTAGRSERPYTVQPRQE